LSDQGRIHYFFSSNISYQKSFYTFTICLIFSILIGFLKYDTNYPIQNTEIYPLKNGWEYRIGDSPRNEQGVFTFLNDPNLKWSPFLNDSFLKKTEEAKILWIRIQLPSLNLARPGIYFYNVTDVFEAYIDGKIIFNDYPIEKDTDSLTKGLNRHEILSLEKEHLGKTLYLRIASGWKDVGIAGIPLLGNTISLLFYNLKDYALMGISGVAYICFSLIGIYFLYQRPEIKIVFYFSMLSLLSGITTIHHSPFKYLIYNEPMYWTHINTFTILGTIYFFIGYFSEFFENKFQFYKIGKGVILFFILLNTLILFTVKISLVHFYYLERPVVIFVAVMIFYTLYRLYVSASEGNYLAKVLLIGKSILLISLFSFFLHTLGFIPHRGFFFPLGFNGLILSIAFISVKRYTEIYDIAEEYSKNLMIKNAELSEVNAQLKDLHEFKERIFFDIHDHIGGDISELLILQNQLRNYSVPDSHIEYNVHLLRKINQNVRNKMQMIQDFNNIQENFAMGLSIYLLRRFGSVERKCKLEFQEGLADIFEEFPHSKKQVLFSIATEIANNDLKYGYANSEWIFTSNGSDLFWRVTSNTNYKVGEKSGEGTRGIQNRLKSVQGTFAQSLEGDRIFLEIKIPI